MKERILSWLQKFSSENYKENQDLISIQQKLKEDGQHVDLEELHRRSKKLLDYILHHYSRLNIGTIDKFNARLVRSFSYELGLAKNFNLEIKPEPFLIEAVDKLLDKIGENQEVTHTMLNFVNYRLDNEERINLNSTLYKTAKDFVSDIHYERLKNNRDFNTENYHKANKEIQEEIKNLEKNAVEIAEKSIELIKQNNLEIADFAGGKSSSMAKFFYEFLKFINNQRATFPFPGNEEAAQEKFQKGASSKSKNKETEIFQILDKLIENRFKIIRNYIEINKKEKIFDALLPLKVNQDIQNELELIEQENDVVLLSKFNILINENLRDEPSAFIYEKVGTQFHHFFIDEFQDTSTLQWQNFIPLRNHSVSSDQTSFTLVGDPKQSIYRFRGGDSQLMLDIIQHQENTPKKADVTVLKENWRSAKNIVEFNNQLYQYLSQGLTENHQLIFGKNAQQNAQSKENGRVKINLTENGTNEEFYQDVSEKMQQNIQECLKNGFKFSDITILCRGNHDIFKFSQLLNALKVHYNGFETHIKTISESGLTLELSDTINALIQFLYWENNPKNNQYFSLMMYYLKELGRVEMHDFTGEMLEMLSLKNREEIIEHLKEKYHLHLRQDQVPQLNLYNFIEFYLQEFSVENKETDFLLNFLETLYTFTQNSGATIKDFLQFWEEEARKQTIQASENVNAIQLMTIHKAKGLEFPIVFYPMLNNHKDGNFSEWFEVKNEFGLQAVNLTKFGNNLDVYDEEIEKFNAENEYKNYIDRLCVQYVATTRPVEQLFLYLQRPGVNPKTGTEKESKIKIYDFVQQKNPENWDEFEFFAIENQADLKKKSQSKTRDYLTKSISHFGNRSVRKSSIKIATPSKNYQARKETVKNGIFTHEILSKINSKKDIDHVMEGYVLQGLITNEEKNEIGKNLRKIISQYPDYFAENLEIINEKDLMVSEDGESKIYRPDRLIKTENGYFIIDFKTGEERKKDEVQIENYKNILEKFGRKVIGTEVIYL